MPTRRPAGGRGGRRAAATQITKRLQAGLTHHRAGRLAEAAAAYAGVLAIVPEHPDALHLAGLVAHAGGETARAEALIERAIALRPDAAVFLNSLGVVRLEMGASEAALLLFDGALAADPLYAEAWLNRGNALQRLGRLAEAVAAYDAALARRPAYPEALAGAGRALHRLGQPAAAVPKFEEALRLRPDWPKVLRWLGDSLAETGRRDAALAALDRALVAAPDDAETLAALAALAERQGRLEEAVALADRALAADPGAVRAALAAARALRRQGRTTDGLIRLAPFVAAAAPSTVAAPPPAETTEAAEAIALIHFERAMLLDRQGEVDQAFAAFAEAHRQMETAAPPSDADRAFFPALIGRLAARFTPAWIAGWTPAADPDPGLPQDPVFLIGFPRSGTTLLEQILDAHSALATVEEIDAVDVVRRAVDALPGGYPDALAGLGAEEQRALRRRYWAAVAAHLARPIGDRRLVDKMPLNTIDAGLIHRLFPQAQFLLALRHPADVVLSNFMQAFKPNAAMVHAATPSGAARFYAEVMGLWQHYARLLPLAALPVRYEDLVADVAGEARRIIGFLGLPWDDGVLAYRERARDRTIATPSYHQVVEPIYRRAVGRWRRYRRHLGETEALLAPFIAAFGYAATEGETGTPPVS